MDYRGNNFNLQISFVLFFVIVAFVVLTTSRHILTANDLLVYKPFLTNVT